MVTNKGLFGDFAISEGGLFDRTLLKMHLHNKQGKLALVSLCIAWLPLVIFTAIAGTFYSGSQLPFLKDVSMQARILVALPILVFIKFAIDSKVSAVAKYLSEALMDEEQRQLVLSKVLYRAKRLTTSLASEIILLLIVVLATISLVKGNVLSELQSGKTSWMAFAKDERLELSTAGYWAVIISIPIFQFLLLRWLWRYFVWTMLLLRLSRAELNLLPTHADRSGGLGIIMLAQRRFNLIFVAGSVVISGQFIAQIMANRESFNVIRGEVVAYIIFCIVLILIPLLFFTAKLVKAKDEGLLHLSSLAATMSGKFEKEWVNDLPIEKKVEEDHVDPSMLYDYNGLYDTLQQLRTVPITVRNIIGMAFTLFVPFIPIPLLYFSVPELLQRIVGLLV
jgi:hypothetical protein